MRIQDQGPGYLDQGNFDDLSNLRDALKMGIFTYDSTRVMQVFKH